jgi:hypothetical protein
VRGDRRVDVVIGRFVVFVVIGIVVERIVIGIVIFHIVVGIVVAVVIERVVVIGIVVDGLGEDRSRRRQQNTTIRPKKKRFSCASRVISGSLDIPSFLVAVKYVRQLVPDRSAC